RQLAQADVAAAAGAGADGGAVADREAAGGDAAGRGAELDVAVEAGAGGAGVGDDGLGADAALAVEQGHVGVGVAAAGVGGVGADRAADHQVAAELAGIARIVGLQRDVGGRRVGTAVHAIAGLGAGGDAADGDAAGGGGDDGRVAAVVRGDAGGRQIAGPDAAAGIAQHQVAVGGGEVAGAEHAAAGAERDAVGADIEKGGRRAGRVDHADGQRAGGVDAQAGELVGGARTAGQVTDDDIAAAAVGVDRDLVVEGGQVAGVDVAAGVVQRHVAGGADVAQGQGATVVGDVHGAVGHGDVAGGEVAVGRREGEPGRQDIAVHGQSAG